MMNLFVNVWMIRSARTYCGRGLAAVQGVDSAALAPAVVCLARRAPKPVIRGFLARRRLHCARLLFSVAALAGAPVTAHAAILSGEMVDMAANVIAILAILIVPVVVIALFLYVHVLPERIAERRHHPQKAAIKALCLMSLAFGGLLWPLAWLWAYSRPVAYKLAYGTEKHEDYFKEAREHAEKGDIAPALLEEVRLELDGLAARGQLTPELRAIRNRLAVLESEAEVPRVQETSAPVSAPPPHGEGPNRGTV